MNTPLFEAPIKTILTDYHAPTLRYRHLAFSSKNLAMLEQITDALETLLPVVPTNQCRLNIINELPE